MSVTSAELALEDNFGIDAYNIVTVENGGDGVSGRVALKTRFYDAAGELLSEEESYLHSLQPGESWRAVTMYWGDADAAEIDSVDARVDAERSAPAFDSAALEIVESELTVDDWDAKVYGTVENTGASPFESVTIIAWFYR